MSTETPLPTVTGDSFILKKFVYKNYSTPVELKEVKCPVPSPPTTDSNGNPILVQSDELLIKVKAASVNPVDLLLKHISFKLAPGGSTDKSIGLDFSGVVVQLGSDVNKTFHKKNEVDGDLTSGDEIYGSVFPAGLYGGSFSEYILVKAKDLRLISKIPQGMSFSQAASLPIVACTAFEVLNNYKGPSLKGKNILIFGAGTSIGYFATQFAKHYFEAGQVIATCSKASKKDVIDAGADLTIDYHEGPAAVKKQLLDYVKEHGKFDIIYYSVPNPEIYPYLSDILKPKQEFGNFSLILGATNMSYGKLSVFSVLPALGFFRVFLLSKLQLNSFDITPFGMKGGKNLYPAINKLFHEGKLKIRIDSEYPLEEASKALEKVSTGTTKGKAIIKLY